MWLLCVLLVCNLDMNCACDQVTREQLTVLRIIYLFFKKGDFLDNFVAMSGILATVRLLALVWLLAAAEMLA